MRQQPGMEPLAAVLLENFSLLCRKAEFDRKGRTE